MEISDEESDEILEVVSSLRNIKPIKCEMPGCDKPHHLMGLCWYHFTFN